jgi:hypothetical protein
MGRRQWTGWYPSLFYSSTDYSTDFMRQHSCDVWDPLVTDVHTDWPDETVDDPGAVIHEGVGKCSSDANRDRQWARWDGVCWSGL